VIEGIESFTDQLLAANNATDSVALTRENFAIFAFQVLPANGPFSLQVEIASESNNLSDAVFSTSSIPSLTSLVSVVISSDTLLVLQNVSNQSIEQPQLGSILYPSNSPLFQDTNLTEDVEIGSGIFSFFRSPMQGPALQDLDQPIVLEFLVESNAVSAHLEHGRDLELEM
jgi:hypothetical protein